MTWDYPTYMTDYHEDWLSGINSAMSAASFPTLTVYDPDTDLATMLTAINTFGALVAAIDEHTDYDTIYANATNLADTYFDPAAYIAARVTAHSTTLDTELNTKVYPRFLAGMRNINAVLSSAFVIGQAAIAQDKLDKVAKFQADMELQVISKRVEVIQAIAAEMMRLKLQKLEFNRAIAAMTIDYARLVISAKEDEYVETKSAAIEALKWPLEKYKYGANLLAGITGGVSGTAAAEGSKSARIIGSALSGAAAGAMIGAATIGGGGGEGIGAVLGAVLGGISA
jgi:hypothetical protein